MTALPMVVSPSQLADALASEPALLVDLCKPEVHAAAHLPGAVHVDYAQLVLTAPPVGGLLPPPAHLASLLSSSGITPDRHVLAYDDEGGGRASRLLWTLYALGFDRLSLLDGGRSAWESEGRTVESGAVRPSVTADTVRQPSRGVADSEWIRARLGDPDVVLLDTRTPAEFSGSDRRAARGGHIPGAVNVDWTLTMDAANYRRLRPRDELLALYREAGVSPEREVVAYCQTHHRSSHTFVVLKHLGFERVRGYPGAWSEWGNREDLPVAAGAGGPPGA